MLGPPDWKIWEYSIFAGTYVRKNKGDCSKIVRIASTSIYQAWQVFCKQVFSNIWQEFGKYLERFGRFGEHRLF